MSEAKLSVGYIVGCWTVLERVGSDALGNATWRCEASCCGAKKIRSTKSLMQVPSTMCTECKGAEIGQKRAKREARKSVGMVSPVFEKPPSVAAVATMRTALANKPAFPPHRQPKKPVYLGREATA